MRVSNDGVFGGIYVQSNEIFIYRFMAANGDLLPEKIASKPIETHKINIGNFRKMLDLYIFKKPGSGVGNDQDDYQMYVLFEEGILLYNSIDRRTEPQVVHDSLNEGLYLSAGLSDCRNGILMVDVVQKLANNTEEHFIERFKGFDKYTQKHVLEGQKQMLYFFKDYVVEVKQVTKAALGPGGTGATSS